MEELGALKRQMLAGRPVHGCWITLFSPLASEIVGQAGYDCVMIDLEHGPGGYLDAIQTMQALGPSTIPLIRVPGNSDHEIKRALDTGAEGIMIPTVNSPEEAAAAAAACRYPGAGRRGNAASVIRASRYGSESKAYQERIDAALLVICQIETAEAAARAYDIAEVEGVDMIFIGPSDLSATLGHLGELDHPEVRKAIAGIEQGVKRAGKLLGGLPTPGRSAEELFAAGYDLVLADGDVRLLRNGARASVASLNRLLKR